MHTEVGTMPIKEISAGQKVWSYNVARGEKVLSSVVKTMQGVAKKLVRVFIGKDTLQATEEHPFYVNKQWVTAKDLRKGVSVLLLSGMLGAVDSVAMIDTLVTTYNFEVAQTHNYFVGFKGILVHNACIKTTAITSELAKFLNRKYLDPVLEIFDGSGNVWQRFNKASILIKEADSKIEIKIDDANTISNTLGFSKAIVKNISSDYYPLVSEFFNIPELTKKGKLNPDYTNFCTALNGTATSFGTIQIKRDRSGKITALIEEGSGLPNDKRLDKRCRFPALKQNTGEWGMNFEIKRSETYFINKGITTIPTTDFQPWSAWTGSDNAKYINIHVKIDP